MNRKIGNFHMSINKVFWNICTSIVYISSVAASCDSGRPVIPTSFRVQSHHLFCEVFLETTSSFNSCHVYCHMSVRQIFPHKTPQCNFFFKYCTTLPTKRGSHLGFETMFHDINVQQLLHILLQIIMMQIQMLPWGSIGFVQFLEILDLNP